MGKDDNKIKPPKSYALALFAEDKYVAGRFLFLDCGIYIPALDLLFASVELFFKAFLFEAGVPMDELSKKENGHNLHILFKKMNDYYEDFKGYVKWSEILELFTRNYFKHRYPMDDIKSLQIYNLSEKGIHIIGANGEFVFKQDEFSGDLDAYDEIIRFCHRVYADKVAGPFWTERLPLQPGNIKYPPFVRDSLGSKVYGAVSIPFEIKTDEGEVLRVTDIGEIDEFIRGHVLKMKNGNVYTITDKESIHRITMNMILENSKGIKV